MSPRRGANNPKTDVAVPVAHIVPATIRRTAVPRTDEPRTTPQLLIYIISA